MARFLYYHVPVFQAHCYYEIGSKKVRTRHFDFHQLVP